MKLPECRITGVKICGRRGRSNLQTKENNLQTQRQPKYTAINSSCWVRITAVGAYFSHSVSQIPCHFLKVKHPSSEKRVNLNASRSLTELSLLQRKQNSPNKFYLADLLLHQHLRSPRILLWKVHDRGSLCWCQTLCSQSPGLGCGWKKERQGFFLLGDV